MPQPPRPLDPTRDAASRFGAALRDLRERARLSQSQLGTQAHVSGSLVGKIEKADRKCDLPLAQCFDSILCAQGELVHLWQKIESQDGEGGAQGTAGFPLEPKVSLQESGDCWEHPLAVARRVQSMAATNVDSATLGVLHHSCDDIVFRYEAEGPQRLAPVAHELRSFLHELLSGMQHPAQRHELYVLAAKASGLLGYMAVNAGRLALARSYCSEALQLAEVVAENDLVAWVHGTRSLEAYYDARYADAYEFAMAGVRVAPDGPQAIRLLSNGVARALGKLGDRYGTEKAIHRARELSEDSLIPGGLTPCISFAPYGRARTLANAATAHVSLGNIPTVLAYADDVDEAVEEADSVWSRSLVSLDVAMALLQQPVPELEQAMALGHASLEVCEDHPIRSVVQRSRELLQQAAGQWERESAVREYSAALNEWQRRPAAEVLMPDAAASPKGATQ